MIALHALSLQPLWHTTFLWGSNCKKEGKLGWVNPLLRFFFFPHFFFPSRLLLDLENQAAQKAVEKDFFSLKAAFYRLLQQYSAIRQSKYTFPKDWGAKWEGATPLYVPGRGLQCCCPHTAKKHIATPCPSCPFQKRVGKNLIYKAVEVTAALFLFWYDVWKRSCSFHLLNIC